MRISPISNSINQNRNFTGISREISKRFVESGSFGGDQGDYDKFVKVVEYRPFADETEEEIQENVKKLEKLDIYTPPSYTYPGSYTVYPDSELTYTEVVVGERLHCTKEEAALVTTEALRKK